MHPRRNYTGDRGIGEVCGEGYQLPEENKRCFSEDHWRAPNSNPLTELIQALPGTVQPALPTNQVKAKLPKLILPKFRGGVTTWTGFWDSYKSAVHDNEILSKINKFNYLKSLLEGAASRAIQGLTLSSSNYDSVVEILEQRFGRPQQITSAHMDEILKIQPCASDRPSSLRFLYNKLSVHVRGLSSLGVSSEQYGSLLIPIIMSNCYRTKYV